MQRSKSLGRRSCIARGPALRDYFAAAALTGLSPTLNGKDAAEAARRAYQAADAMLAQRSIASPDSHDGNR